MMKAWSKYSQVLNDPVRNLNMKLTFQNGDVTMVHPHHLAANVRLLFSKLTCSSIVVVSFARDIDSLGCAFSRHSLCSISTGVVCHVG